MGQVACNLPHLYAVIMNDMQRKRWLPRVIIATLVVTIGLAVAGNTFTDGADQPSTTTEARP